MLVTPLLAVVFCVSANSPHGSEQAILEFWLFQIRFIVKSISLTFYCGNNLFLVIWAGIQDGNPVSLCVVLAS